MSPEERRQKVSFYILFCGIVTVWAIAPLTEMDSLPVWLRIPVMTLPVQGVFLCSALIPARIFARGRTFRELFDLKRLSPASFLKACACGCTLCFFSMLLTGSWSMFLRSIGIPVKEQEFVRLLSEYGSPEVFGVLFLTGGFLAPVCEELAFRYVVGKYMERYFPFYSAVMGSALLFAMIHCNLQTLPALTFLGFSLSVLYKKTGSLLTPVTVHSAFNITTLLLFLVRKLIS